MDKLVRELLLIEQTAIHSMDALEEERKAGIQLTSEEITRRCLAIKRKADEKLKVMKQETETNTQARLDEIERVYQHKAESLKSLFEGNRDTWRVAWAGRILQKS